MHKISFQACNLTLFAKSLSVLKIWCPYVAVSEFDDYSWAERIPVVDIHLLEAPSNAVWPQFPVFFGKKLSLNRFSLALWHNQELPNVIKVYLSSCYHLDPLPEMPQLESLEFCYCAFERLPAVLPSLKELSLSRVSRLKSIPFYPSLLDVKFPDRCSDLKDILNCAHVKKLAAFQCFEATTLPKFNKIDNLALLDCNVPSIDAIKGMEEDFMMDRRKVKLHRLSMIHSFSSCKYIYDLHLVGLDHLQSCAGISHIHHLLISKCPNLVSCKGLSQILGSATFDRCDSLCSLDGLRGIPKVVLENCTSLNRFEGLGKHDSLHIVNIPAFLVFLDEFRNNNLHRDILGSVKQLFVTSSRSRDGKESQVW
jgi:hypothetical protein